MCSATNTIRDKGSLVLPSLGIVIKYDLKYGQEATLAGPWSWTSSSATAFADAVMYESTCSVMCREIGIGINNEGRGNNDCGYSNVAEPPMTTASSFTAVASVTAVASDLGDERNCDSDDGYSNVDGASLL